MYYNQPQVQNKPTAAYIVSLLGGIIGLLASLYVMIVMGVLAYATIATLDYGYGYAADLSGILLFYIAFGAWMLITSILIIVFARRLNANPMQHSKYGAYIIILSIIGIGGLLGLIGGILALVYKPIPAGAPPAYAPQPQAPPPAYGPAPAPPQQAWTQQQGYTTQPITRICPGCGRVVKEDVKFCGSCGRQLN